MKPLQFIKSASAKSESDSNRNGFLSHRSETHALGVGMGLSWLALVTGDMALLGIVIPAITSGLRAKDKEFSKILKDVYEEPHYSLFGLVLGGVLALPWAALPI